MTAARTVKLQNQQQIFLSSYCFITHNIMAALRPTSHNNNKNTQGKLVVENTINNN